MDHANVDRVALGQAATAAANLAAELDSACTGLVGLLSPLLGTAFSGLAAGAFGRKLDELTQDVKLVTTALDDLSHKVTSAGTHYHGTDDANVAPIQQVAAGGSVAASLRLPR